MNHKQQWQIIFTPFIYSVTIKSFAAKIVLAGFVNCSYLFYLFLVYKSFILKSGYMTFLQGR